MVVENFSRKVVSSGIFNTFIATGFFATLIFFVLNAHLFTPWEIVFGTVLVTIGLKGISNIMLSLVILLFNLENIKSGNDIKLAEDKIDLLLNDMKMKEANIKAIKLNDI
jgi:hypothetical protein